MMWSLQWYLATSAVSLATAQSVPFFFGRSRDMYAIERRQSSTITWPYQKFLSEPDFLPPVPEVNKTKNTAPGYQFLAQQGTSCAQQAAMIMTDDGELIWQSNPKAPFPVSNFSPQTLHGKPVLVANTAVGAPITESGSITYSIVQIYDDTYTLMYNVLVTDPTFNFAAGNWSSLIDSHEAYITTRNTLIVPAYNITPWDLSPVGGPKDGWLMDSVFYEVTVPEGEILYSWRSSEHISVTDSFVELDSVYGYGNSTGWAWDYFHMNSIQSWGEDGYLISGRNTFDILFVNKTTGSVQWRLRGKDGGEFTLDKEGQFSWQHNARLHEYHGELLLSMFDNRNTLTPPFVPSEGHLLCLDLAAKTAKIRGIYVNRNANVAAQFAGSMQVDFTGKEEKYVVVGHGSQPVTEEYDLDGTLRMSWRFGPADPNAAAPGIANYRAYKTIWKGYPATSPAVKACKTANGTDVFVSWNGATEVTSWRVYAGKSEYDMAESASAAKTGFETKISLDGVAAMVKVKAEGKVHDERFTAKTSMSVAVQDC